MHARACILKQVKKKRCIHWFEASYCIWWPTAAPATAAAEEEEEEDDSSCPWFDEGHLSTGTSLFPLPAYSLECHLRSVSKEIAPASLDGSVHALLAECRRQTIELQPFGSLGSSFGTFLPATSNRSDHEREFLNLGPKKNGIDTVQALTNAGLTNDVPIGSALTFTSSIILPRFMALSMQSAMACAKALD